MSGIDQEFTGQPRRRMEFTSTSWTAVMKAGNPDQPGAQEALEHLCQVYWYPLYAYARRRGLDAHAAEDVTQDFFHRLLRGNYLRLADRNRGKFRSFLLTSLSNFISNQRRQANAIRRGGAHKIISLDAEYAENQYLKDSIPDSSAVKVFERGWAMTLIQEAKAKLHQEYADAQKESLFRCLKVFLGEESSKEGYEKLADQLEMKRGAVAVAVHRLRQRYGQVLRQTVSDTLLQPTPAEVDAELQHLLSSVEDTKPGA